MLSPTVHRTIVFVDVADFTNPSRNVVDLLAVQEGVYRVLQTAFDECGIDYGSCHTGDRGDGMLIMIPPEISKSRLVDLLPDRLVAELRRYNATHTPTAQFKLRVGIHAGDIRWNTNSWVGPAVNLTARIIEADEVKSALAQSDGLVALTVSDYFYTEVIKQDPGVAPEQYRRIDVTVKQFSGNIWLRIPGATVPAPAVPRPSAGRLSDPELVPLDEGGFDVVPAEELAALRGWLSDLEVPHLATLVTRAVGSAIPPPRPTSAWGVFCYLSDFNAGPDGVPPALAYLKLLAREVGGEIKTSVSAWVDQQSRRLRRFENLDKLLADWEPIPEEPPLHLMIIVEPDAIDPGRGVLSYWRQDDPLVWPPARCDVREVALDELEYQVDEIILATEEVWADQAAAAVIELVLPRSMITIPVQRWRKEHQSGQPRPLIFDYQLRLRSLERMRTIYWHRSWKARWRSMVNHSSLNRIHPFGPTNTDERIDAVLSDTRWLGVVMEHPPPPEPGAAEPDVLTAALRAGLPLICWHPAAGPEDLREQVDWLLGGVGGLIDLPARRQVALVSGSNSDNLVYDLVVMWEDPYRVISFDRPSTSIPQ